MRKASMSGMTRSPITLSPGSRAATPPAAKSRLSAGDRQRRHHDLTLGGVISDSRVLRKRDVVRVDRKSTRLNSSHGYISYAVFCLEKKKKELDNDSAYA